MKLEILGTKGNNYISDINDKYLEQKLNNLFKNNLEINGCYCDIYVI